MKKLLLILMFTPLVSFGQTSIPAEDFSAAIRITPEFAFAYFRMEEAKS